MLSSYRRLKQKTPHAQSVGWKKYNIYISIISLLLHLIFPFAPRTQNDQTRLSLAGPEMVSILPSPGRDNIRKIFLKINVFQSAGREVSQVSGEKIGFSS